MEHMAKYIQFVLYTYSQAVFTYYTKIVIAFIAATHLPAVGEKHFSGLKF